MFGDGPLTFREFCMREPLPLATIHDAVLEFLCDRDDAALYGAQAVNAYVSEARMTQDVDILSPRAEALAEELRAFLSERFHIAVRIRSVAEGRGLRLYQLRKEEAGGNRHLVDVRPVDHFPPTQRVRQVLVIAPVELIVMKVISTTSRTNTAKGLIDRADLRRLFLTYPDLKKHTGAVRDRLEAAVADGADPAVLDTWAELVEQRVEPEDEDAGY